MNDAKYIGLDVHQATISATVLDAEGKLVMEAILETKAETVLQLIHGLRGSLHVTFEEGTSAAWLYTLIKPHVTRVLVCDPRKNALLKAGEGVVTTSNMNLRKEKTPRTSQHYLGCIAQRTTSLSPVAGEIFLLTIPSIERA